MRGSLRAVGPMAVNEFVGRHNVRSLDTTDQVAERKEMYNGGDDARNPSYKS